RCRAHTPGGAASICDLSARHRRCEMTSSLLRRRTLALAAAIVPVLALLIYVALRSGPLAPVAVTEARVETQPIHPAVFGIGTVEARYTYKIGPTSAG